MLRTLLTPRWMKALAIALAFGVACFFLGRWQWNAHVRQQTKIAAIERNYDAAPVPVEQVTHGGPMTPEHEWTHVTLTGTYEPQHEFLVRGRNGGPNDRTGYEVLVPLRTSNGIWMVDRGWIPAGESASQVPEHGGPTSGQVTVSGWLRKPEMDRDKSLPKGQLASMHLTQVGEQLGEKVNETGYVVLGSEKPGPTGSSPQQPLKLPRAHEDLGPHQGYAFQWWLFMPCGVIFVLVQARRARELEALEHEGLPATANASGGATGSPHDPRRSGTTTADSATGGSATAGSAAAGSATTSGPDDPRGASGHRDEGSRHTRPDRKKKVRIWDEEDW